MMTILNKLLARFSIRAKLWIGFGLMVVILAIVVATNVRNLSATRGSMVRLVKDIQPAVLDSMQLATQLDHASASLGFYLLSKEEGYRTAYQESLRKAREGIAALREQPLVEQDGELRALVADIEAKVEQFAGYEERMLPLVGSDAENFPAIRYSAENINPLSQRVLQLMTQMILSEMEEPAERRRKDLFNLLHDLRYAWANVMNGIRAYLAFRSEVSLQEVALYQENIDKLVRRLQEREQLLTLDQADSLEQFMALRKEYRQNFEQLVAIHGSERWRSDAHLLRSEIGPLLGDIKYDLDRLVEGLRARIEADSSQMLEKMDTTRRFAGVMLLIGLLLGGIGAWIISSLIAKPLQAAVTAMNGIAQGEGDLTCELGIRGRDELGQLCEAFNRFIAKIRQIVAEVSQSTGQLHDASVHMSRISDGAREGAMRQRSETEQVAAAMNEMTATAHDMAQNAQLAAQAAKEADGEASNGRGVVSKTIDSIDNLAKAVEQAAEVVQKLESDSQNIDVILDVIRGVAEQTNLLALNAAIEAARAGEHGRGFAVVADEVRTLAARSQQSTEEIRVMIEELQAAARQAASVMDQGREQAKASVEQAAQAGDSLEVITRAVATIREMNGHIAEAAGQQGEVAESINRSIARISQVAEQSAEGTEELASASQQMGRLANQLRSLVGRFKA